MFTVEVKTNQPWQVRQKFVDANKWIQVATADSQMDAEKHLSWIDLDIQDATQFLKNFKAEYRICSGGKIIWKK